MLIELGLIALETLLSICKINETISLFSTGHKIYLHQSLICIEVSEGNIK